MPIKTMNNNGLQVLEEVPGEYKIYIDKDAVMTTVAKYAPGSYQTFMERKVDVDNSRSLLIEHKIEWTQKDDSDLFIQCNNEALSKIENQPITLDEPTQPVVLEPKTVPTTYECCFRVDKKSGEIYIGEGYENLGYSISSYGSVIQKIKEDSNIVVYEITGKIASYKGIVTYTSSPSSKDWESASLRFRLSVDGKVVNPSHIGMGNTLTSVVSGSSTKTLVANSDGWIDAKYSVQWDKQSGQTIACMTIVCSSLMPNEDFKETFFEFDKRNFTLTKTSTPKPFVKSIMPSGKLAFVTSATETTHTFLNKGDGVITFGNGYFSLKGDKIDKLLVYKGILTEEQKQIELNKTFKVR